MRKAQVKIKQKMPKSPWNMSPGERKALRSKAGSEVTEYGKTVNGEKNETQKFRFFIVATKRWLPIPTAGTQTSRTALSYMCRSVHHSKSFHLLVYFIIQNGKKVVLAWVRTHLMSLITWTNTSRSTGRSANEPLFHLLLTISKNASEA